MTLCCRSLEGVVCVTSRRLRNWLAGASSISADTHITAPFTVSRDVSNLLRLVLRR